MDLEFPQTLLDTITAVGAFATLVGLVADHLWVRSQLKRSKRRDEYHRTVEVPIREEMSRLADFLTDVSDWQAQRNGQTCSTVTSTGKRVSRKLNQTIVFVAGSEFGKSANWLAIKTDDLDDTLSEINPDLVALHSKTLLTELDRLERQLQETLAGARPN